MKKRLLGYDLSDANPKFGFTIVELIVVIVIIGVLAAITIVSYTGISQQATIASVKSDLSSSSNILKLYQTEYGVYPTSLDINNCPVGPVDINYCLRSSSGNIYNYSSDDSQTFILGAFKGSINYSITENSSPVAIDVTKIKLTVDHTKVYSDQTNFSIYINLSTMPQQFWDSVSPNGGDIRLYNSTQEVELPREIVHIDNSTKTGEVWFKGDISSSQDTIFYISCGTGYVEYDINAIYGSRAVWGENIRAYHLDDTTSGTVTDSGQGSYTGDKSTSNTPIEVAAKIGKGQSFDGVGNSGAINVNETSIDVSQPHTFTAWVKLNATPDYNDNGIVDRFQMLTGSFSKGTKIAINTGGYLKFENGYSSSTNDSQSLYSDSPLSPGVFYFVSGVYDGVNIRIQLNDAHKSIAKTASPISRPGTNLRIGDTHHSNGTINGIVDEVRVFKEAISIDTLNTMYSNQLSPDTFYSSTYVN